MKIAIIGCGLIGCKRALALTEEDILTACCDVNYEIAKKFGDEFNCKVFTDHKRLFSTSECDVVIVAVVNKFIKDIVVDALKLGKHVIAEKPLGRNYYESKEMYSVYKKNSAIKHIVFKIGFNHRFHPAILYAKELLQNGSIGKVINIRGRYGHGGRPGMEKEWRASKELCGGGELLDQGVHMIDLVRWFGGEIKEVFAKVETKFWNMGVEDNAFAILKTENNVTASFHVSWTNWKNIFSFEAFGTNGYVRVEGLGGSYGIESLEYGKRNEKGGRPEIQIIEYPADDISWNEEWKEFKNALRDQREVIGNGYDGMKANQVIDALYKSNKESKTVFIK